MHGLQHGGSFRDRYDKGGLGKNFQPCIPYRERGGRGKQFLAEANKGSLVFAHISSDGDMPVQGLYGRHGGKGDPLQRQEFFSSFIVKLCDHTQHTASSVALELKKDILF